MVDIAVTVALLDDDRIVVVAITVANYIMFMDHIDVAVTMTFPDGHTRADRTDAHADFIGARPARRFRLARRSRWLPDTI
jgi:hypothetical protein